MNADQVLNDLGETFGIANLSFNSHNCLQMRANNGRTFGFEKREEALLVFLSEPVPHGLAERLLKGLMQAHGPAQSAWPVQLAVRDLDGIPNLLMIVRLPENDLSLSNAQKCLSLLDTWGSRP